MSKKLKLNDLNLKSFVTGEKLTGGNQSIAQSMGHTLCAGADCTVVAICGGEIK